jgi:tetratricopeptide (TPR) repeat protein
VTLMADSIPTGRDDPLYSKGQEHLQKGEWEEAVSTFEELQRGYPDSPVAQQALQQAQLRASIGAGRRVRARRTTLRFWPILLRLVIIAAIGYLVYTGGTLLVERVQPIILQAQETQRLEQLMVEARAFLEAGDLSAAEVRYTEILNSEPENEEALRAMAIIEEEQLVETLYAEAIALDDAGDVDAAMESYVELSELRAGFRDIDRRMAAIAGAKELEQLFAEANAAYDIRDVEGAIAGYEAVRERNVAYEQDVVEGRLVLLYFGIGDEIVKREPPKLEELSVALDYFSKALSLDPRNQIVGRERQLL